MNKDYYPYFGNASKMTFEFESDGRNGKIKKEVQYTLVNDGGFVYFNLGFGDLNEQTGDINDLSISNNEDRDKILNTVAATVLEFTNYFPKAVVYAKGSTPGRTRLYRMGIAANLEEIGQYLEVFGRLNGQWWVFEKNANYEAFIVLRK